MKKYNCPFCKIRLDNDYLPGDALPITMLWFCGRTTCKSKFNIHFKLNEITAWSFHLNDIKIVNTISENYCYCAKLVQVQVILKPRLNPISNQYGPLIQWETLFECEAWDTDPFNKTALLEKLNYYLTFS